MNNCYISPVNFMKCIFCLVSKYLSIDLIDSSDSEEYEYFCKWKIDFYLSKCKYNFHCQYYEY